LDGTSHRGSDGSAARPTEAVLCDVCGTLLSRLGIVDYASEPPGERYSEEQFATRLRCSSCPGLAYTLDLLKAAYGTVENIRIYLQWDGDGDISALCITGHVPGQYQEQSWVPLPLGADLNATGMETSLGRVWNPSLVDADLLRQWLTNCAQNHGAECRQPVMPRPTHRMLLVDTRRYCLVDSCGMEEYAALSYVWGTSVFLKTTVSNVENLRREQSLLHGGDSDYQLAATVKDAIRLAAAIGINYIWVDCLCIVQDDTQTINIHLKSMAAIYANAYVTFVVAAGKDASSGIPGAPGGSQARDFPCCTFDTRSGSRFVLSPATPYWHLSSEWSQRAWTYQEDFFSTRLLFLGYAATWQCSGYWLQETTRATMSPSSDARPHLAIEGSTGDQGWHRMTAYSFLVAQYNARDLTYDGDVLAAIAGVHEVLQSHFPNGFRYGIPVVEGDQMASLTWRVSGGARRRVAFVAGTTINKLPSWSWIGWQGSVEFVDWFQTKSQKPYCTTAVFPHHKKVNATSSPG